LASINIRSLNSNFESLSKDFAGSGLDVIAVQEVWRTVPNKKYSILGFDDFHGRTRSGRGGGVGLWISNKLEYTIIDSPFDEVNAYFPVRKPVRTRDNPVQRIIQSKKNLQALDTEVRSFQWLVWYEQQFQVNSLDKIFEEFTSKLRGMIEKTCMKHTKVRQKNSHPLFGANLVQRKKNLTKLYHKMRKKPNSANESAYKKAQRDYNRLIKKTKSDWTCDQLSQSNCTRNNWNIMNKLMDLKGSSRRWPRKMVLDGVSYSDNYSGVFNKHFCNSTHDITIESNKKPPNVERIGDLTLKNVTESCVLSAINNLKSKPSCSWDLLSNKMLKAISFGILPVLTKMFNQSLLQLTFPEVYKQAKVIPVYKGKGSKSNPNSYRPISLLPVISKVFEKLVYDQLLVLFNNHISLQQFGFRHRHSTEHAVVALTTFLANTKMNSKYQSAVFCDLSKAFDIPQHTLNTLNMASILHLSHLWHLT
jgi:hypothetical protein